jgi:acetate kinase
MAGRHVVTLNAGSSSLKFAVFDVGGAVPEALASGSAETSGGQARIKARDPAGAAMTEQAWDVAGDFQDAALERVLAWSESAFPGAEVAGVGHRVVHGGPRHDAPALVTDAVLADLRTLIPLAPLHEPHNIAGIEAARRAWPAAAQVACFDTAFHRGHPFVNDTYGLPRALHDEGVRRYGFHGLSYEYVSGELRRAAPALASGRVAMAHLGSGASMCAMRDGRSVASTMGFTPLDGLPMNTRCGQLDPGAVLYLLQTKRMSADAVADLLYHASGMAGMSGLSGDMRELEASDAEPAHEALDYFVARVRQELGGLAAVLEGLDMVVFCGGVGENSATVRARTMERLEWLGVQLDAEANRAGSPVISARGSRVEVRIVKTDEEAMIARHTADLIGPT